MNATQVSGFRLGAYLDAGLLQYFYFLLVLFLYLSIICTNVFLIVVISVTRSLHEPMYLFLCSLFVNELYGSSGLFPFLLLQILKDTHTVPAASCFLQIFCIYTYASVEFLTLAVMSYDRYLAICRPLQYHTCMTSTKAAMLVAVAWMLPVVEMVVLISLTVPLQLCGNIIHKVYCGNYAIVKLACSDATVNNVYGLVNTATSVFIPLVLIVCSYVRILTVCFSGCRQTRRKAIGTCSPHLASLLNFSFGCCFQILQSRFGLSVSPDVLNVLLSLYFLTCQPMFTPLLYGLKMSKIRTQCRRLLCG